MNVKVAAVGQARRHAVTEWLTAASMLVLARPLLTVAFAPTVAVLISQRRWPLLALLLGLPLLAWSRPRRKPAFAGRLVRQSDEPELAAFVREVAEHAGFTEPLVVRIIPVPDAAIAPTRLRGQRGFALALGWPFLRYLPAQQLAAVIAHELGHHRSSADRRRRWLLANRERLVERLDRRWPAPRFLAEPLLAGTQPLSWRLELEADRVSAQVAGTDAARAALHSTQVISWAFDLYGDRWFSLLLDDRAYPADFFSGLGQALDDPHERRHIEQRLDGMSRFTGVSDSHPSAAVRIESLPSCPPAADFGDRPLALRGCEDLDRWAVQQLLLEPGGAVRPVNVTEIDHDRDLLPVAAARSDLAEATSQVTGTSSLDAALDAIRTESHWRAIADRLDPGLRAVPAEIRALAQRETLAGCLTIVVAGSLADAGWGRVTRWAAGVRTDPQGRVVDVRDVVEQALDSGDPAPVRALIERTVSDGSAVTS